MRSLHKQEKNPMQNHIKSQMEEQLLKFLIVEDEEIMRNLISEMLMELDYQVSTASSAEDALEKLRTNVYDIVITDIKMPGMSGIDLLKAIRKKYANSVCVIVITGYASIETAIEAMKAGAYDYITKPFHLEQFMLIIKRAIERQMLLNNSNQANHYKELAIRDGLTGLYNHWYFHKRLKEELKRSKRYDEDFSLLLLDVDNFKECNDRLGHLKGDEVLKRITELLIQSTREIDFVARYGGDEFAIILYKTSKEKAENCAERIRKSVIENDIGLNGIFPRGYIHISIGIATFPLEANSKNELINLADLRMYKNKEEIKKSWIGRI